VRIEKTDKDGISYIGFEKPSFHHDRNLKQQKKLNIRVKKRNISHDNTVEYCDEKWWNDSEYFKVDQNPTKRPRRSSNPMTNNNEKFSSY